MFWVYSKIIFKSHCQTRNKKWYIWKEILITRGKTKNNIKVATWTAMSAAQPVAVCHVANTRTCVHAGSNASDPRANRSDGPDLLLRLRTVRIHFSFRCDRTTLIASDRAVQIHSLYKIDPTVGNGPRLLKRIWSSSY